MTQAVSGPASQSGTPAAGVDTPLAAFAPDDTLVALVDGRGTVLSKDGLLRRIWPDRVVEENNLEIQISTLRKVLGADRHLIRTVVGRGYQFTGDIRGPGPAVVGASVPIQATGSLR